MGIAPFLIGYVHEWKSLVVPAGRLVALQLRFDEALEAGELDRPVEVVVESGHGLPSGSAHLAQQAYQRLADRGVLAVIGPAITDNALAVINQAEAQHLSTINWSGSGRSRSKYCFHYQLG